MACESFWWLTWGLYLVSFWAKRFVLNLMCLFLHNHWNKGAFLQWSVVPLFLLQCYTSACYDLCLGHLGYFYSPKIHVFGVDGCCKFLSSFQAAHDEGMNHVIQDLNRKGAENIFFFLWKWTLHIKHKINSHLAPWLLWVPGIQKKVISKRKN